MIIPSILIRDTQLTFARSHQVYLICVPENEGISSEPTSRPGPELDFLPTVEAFQRHELTLLRMEDILNTGSGSKPSGLESAGLESNGQGR